MVPSKLIYLMFIVVSTSNFIIIISWKLSTCNYQVSQKHELSQLSVILLLKLWKIINYPRIRTVDCRVNCEFWTVTVQKTRGFFTDIHSQKNDPRFWTRTRTVFTTYRSIWLLSKKLTWNNLLLSPNIIACRVFNQFFMYMKCSSCSPFVFYWGILSSSSLR